MAREESAVAHRRFPSYAAALMPVTSARIAKAWARAAAKPVFTAPSCGRAPGVIKTGSTYRMVLAESDLPRQGSRFVVAEAAKPQGPCTVRGKGQLPGGGGRSQPPTTGSSCGGPGADRRLDRRAEGGIPQGSRR